MKYVCRNKKCSACGVVEDYVSTTYVATVRGLVSKDAPCPVCGQVRQEINENNIPPAAKNISLATYSMASPEQRREMLRRRSHEHFVKNIKERKAAAINTAIQNFKKASKK